MCQARQVIGALLRSLGTLVRRVPRRPRRPWSPELQHFSYVRSFLGSFPSTLSARNRGAGAQSQVHEQTTDSVARQGNTFAGWLPRQAPQRVSPPASRVRLHRFVWPRLFQGTHASLGAPVPDNDGTATKPEDHARFLGLAAAGGLRLSLQRCGELSCNPPAAGG
jgi:hypothetical protein